ncbi:MAG: 3-phosphoshikimate 1-carboxyvinyltransferase [Candidatus Dormibacteria bacterium]
MREVGPALRLQGAVRVPGDKSISHRALIMGSLAQGRSRVSNLSPAADVARTAEALRRCGAWMRSDRAGGLDFEGAGAGRTLHTPQTSLDCGNSGTTMRLMSGVLAGHRLRAVLDGDASLRRRPMGRVADPLRAMGAIVETTQGTAPLTVEGRPPLRGMEHVMTVPSAQVKSAILLAALNGDGPTTVVEAAPTRDHTERMLRLCGIEVATTDGGHRVCVEPGRLGAFSLRVPGDLSSAAFFLGLAATRTGWRVTCPGVTLNRGRTGFLEVLRHMGASVEVREGEVPDGGEPMGDVEVCGTRLRATTIGGALVPRCIDELPLLAVLATQAEGTTVIRDAAGLRLKESDRIASVVDGLTELGARCQRFDDGMAVEGPVDLRAAQLDSGGDHRLAMAWAVAGSLVGPGGGSTRIMGAEAVAVSYPGFFEDLGTLLAWPR